MFCVLTVKMTAFNQGGDYRMMLPVESLFSISLAILEPLTFLL